VTAAGGAEEEAVVEILRAVAVGAVRVERVAGIGVTEVIGVRGEAVDVVERADSVAIVVTAREDSVAEIALAVLAVETVAVQEPMRQMSRTPRPFPVWELRALIYIVCKNRLVSLEAMNLGACF